MKLFGREPAAWLALAGAIITAFSAFVLHLTADQQAVLSAVAALTVGLATAAVTRDGVIAAILGLVKGLLLLMVAFGLHLTADQQAILYTLLAAVLAGFVRTQVVAPAPPAPTAPIPLPLP